MNHFASLPLRCLRAVGGTLALVALALAATLGTAAATPKYQATITNLTSNSDRVISYRHQEHLWQTADGAYHLILNRGTLAPTGGLTLYSSYDGGSTWQFQLGFAGTDDVSVSDGQLSSNNLSVIYQTVEGNLVYQVLRYKPDTRKWVVKVNETAYASADFAAVNPAIGIDAQGTVWCAFDRRDRVTNDVDIRMLARRADVAAWVDTGLVFGPTDHRSIERSARPLPIAGGMGMVFTVREMTYWATRSDDMSLDAPWSISTILSGTPAFRTTDPYASHFSTVSDDQGNTHLMTIDDNHMLYFKRDAVSGLWSPTGTLLSGTKKTAYGQNAIVNGKLAAAWSVQRGFGNAVLSDDQGLSFQTTATLVLPPDAPGVSYGQARVEMPTRSTGPLIILQQYSDNGTIGLLLFTLPPP